MTFFGKSIKSRKIDINKESVSSDDPEMQKRLDRIESNFDRLDAILTDLETRFDLDERLVTQAEEDASSKRIRKKKPR